VPEPRVRRHPEEARQLILETAEKLRVSGGPAAVNVRGVAQRINMTDAGVTHHFGSRDGLLIALLQHGGRRLRRAVEDATKAWIDGGTTIRDLVDSIADVYADGYAELAIALHAAGWRDKGAGLLEPVVDALHAARRRTGTRSPKRLETRLAVAALHQALATEPVYGDAFRRSAGIGEPAAGRDRQQRDWWAKTLAVVLDID
jgi:AcrR family transcriptional regulator